MAVETDAGALGEARLLYLKRFWLAEAEREARPCRRHGCNGCRELSAAAAYALQQLINALALAAVYALLATAYSLIYGLVGRINLAFGEIAVLGAYGAIGGVAAAVALGVGDADRRAGARASCSRPRSRPAGACWSAARWSRRCTRATGSASRS